MKDPRIKTFIENALADHLTCRADVAENIVKSVMESMSSYASIEEFRASGKIGADPVHGDPAVVYLDNLYINFNYKNGRFCFRLIIESEETLFDDIALAEEHLYQWYLYNA